MALFLRPYCHSLLALALFLSSGAAGAAPETSTVTLPSGKTLAVELMVTDHDRAMGLMFRPSLPEDRGLLFVFRASGFHGIWMKNCRFPIDIVWIDDEQRIVHVAENVPPCEDDPCPSYAPLRRATYVLEVNAGQARKEGAVVGSSVSFPLPR